MLRIIEEIQKRDAFSMDNSGPNCLVGATGYWTDLLSTTKYADRECGSFIFDPPIKRSDGSILKYAFFFAVRTEEVETW